MFLARRSTFEYESRCISAGSSRHVSFLCYHYGYPLAISSLWRSQYGHTIARPTTSANPAESEGTGRSAVLGLMPGGRSASSSAAGTFVLAKQGYPPKLDERIRRELGLPWRHGRGKLPLLGLAGLLGPLPEVR